MYICSIRRLGDHFSLSLRPPLCTTGSKSAPDLSHDSRYNTFLKGCIDFVLVLVAFCHCASYTFT